MDSSKKIFNYSFFWTFCTLFCVPFACLHCGDSELLFQDYLRIILSPSKLVTDYFALGGLGATFLNAAICGLVCNILVKISKSKMNETTLAAYFLVLAHCFYGLNIINMSFCIMGVFIYCIATHRPFKENIHIAFFSTALGPFISDFLFRYTLGADFQAGTPQVTFSGVILAVIFSIISGFIVPSLLPGTSRMHRGFNLYKAGLAIGLYGMFAFALFYKTLGIEMPDVIVRFNPIYEESERNYLLFVNMYFIAIFVTTILCGYIGNEKSFSGYRKIWLCDGHSDMFAERFGVSLTFINIGLYGLAIIAFLNFAMLLTKGVGFTGPTTGVIIAAITFSACGQTIRNAWPVALGYIILSLLVNLTMYLLGMEVSWTITTQVYINGLAFATGLCPFTGKYGVKYGIIAGMLDAVLCSSTSLMHGGFVLYNGGFTAGLTAMLLVTILDFYKVKEIEDSDNR